MKTTLRKSFPAIMADEAGTFKAVFSTFNVIDHDMDVTLPGAFKSKQKVRIMQYGHKWGNLPIGIGEIDFDSKEAWVDGKLFLDTEAGMEHYKVIKQVGDLQEWSYGFHIDDAEKGRQDGQEVQYLKALDVFEVSPVMLGAGVGTRTESIKGVLDELIVCAAEGCKEESSILIHVCEKHGSADVVTLAKFIKQALGEADEEVIKALIVELTPLPPAVKGPTRFDMLAELSEARNNSHSMGGLRS